jgi:hypothetical protein
MRMPWDKPTRYDDEAEEHWFLRFIADHVEHMADQQEDFVAALDTVVALVATLQSDSAAADARTSEALASLQAAVTDALAQIAALQGSAADPVVVAQLEADLTAIDVVINGIGVAPAPVV